MPEPNVYWAGTPNYTPGNSGVQYLFPHWTCGGFDGSVSTLQNPDRQASAHYVIEGDRVAQLVSESDSAWHCGNHHYNMRSVSYELVGWAGNPPSYETLDTCARMMARASEDHFGGAPLVLGENVMLHKWVKDTDCPGETDVDWLVERANHYLNGEEEEKVQAVRITQFGDEVHRLYKEGDHFYTADKAEIDSATGFGYVDEGVAWKCPAPSIPVYSLFDGTDHFYTADFEEAERAREGGYTPEGVRFCASKAGVPVFRLYSGGDHFYTPDRDERARLVASGWADEGVAWRV